LGILKQWAIYSKSKEKKKRDVPVLFLLNGLVQTFSFNDTGTQNAAL
jgi:hypothetical protein